MIRSNLSHIKPINKPQDSPNWKEIEKRVHKERSATSKNETEKSPVGLGDRVEQIAQPIAKIIDRAVGTNIQGCGGCKKRKDWLNKNFPDT